MIQVFDNLLLNSREALEKIIQILIHQNHHEISLWSTVKIPNLKNHIKKNFFK